MRVFDGEEFTVHVIDQAELAKAPINITYLKSLKVNSPYVPFNLQRCHQ